MDSENEPKPFQLRKEKPPIENVQEPQVEKEEKLHFSAESETISTSDDSHLRQEIDNDELRRLGGDLARAMQDGGYHPVVIFGTSNSGKTSLLLSLFAALISEPSLKAGLVLCNPILGGANSLGARLHKEAQHTFDVKTQAFMEGEKIDKTVAALPFFIPVELRPVDPSKPPIRFAFLESSGEWYRPNRPSGTPLSAVENLYPELRSELESFIASFQGGISFLYTTPFTQQVTYSAGNQNDSEDGAIESDQLRNASLAVTGVLRTYDKIRATGREDDHHLMLVTKWDAQSIGTSDRASGIEEDRDAVNEFCDRHYRQAVSALQGIGLESWQRGLNAYCAGMINDRGLLQLKRDDDLFDVVTDYPVRLWKHLYKNALRVAGHNSISPFPEAPQQHFVIRMWTKMLDWVSGV